MLKKFLILNFVILMFASAAFSQDTIKQSYTLDEAIRTAKMYNTDLVNAKLEKLKAERKVSEVYSENLIPSIDFSSQYIRAFKKQVFDIFGQRFSVGTDNQIINTLNISEPIPILGTPVFQGIRIAENYENLQGEMVNSAESKVTTMVKKSFFNVLFLREVTNVRQLALNNALENLDVVEKRYRNGVTTEFDYLRAKVQVENSKPALIEAQNNLRISKNLLKNAMGIKVSNDIDVRGELFYDSLEVFGSEEYLINKIAENHVSIRQLNINQKINQQLLQIDKANYLPKLFVFGQFNLNASEDDGRGFGDYRFFNVINAGIGLKWDLNFFKNSYKVQQTEIDIQKTQETISDVKQKLRINAQNVLFKINEAKEKIRSSYESVRLAERGFELAMISYRNGVINQIDVINSQLMLDNARLGYYNNILEYLSAKTDLEELLEKK